MQIMAFTCECGTLKRLIVYLIQTPLSQKTDSPGHIANIARDNQNRAWLNSADPLTRAPSHSIIESWIFIAVTKCWRKINLESKDLFWLIGSEVSISCGLVPLLWTWGEAEHCGRAWWDRAAHWWQLGSRDRGKELEGKVGVSEIIPTVMSLKWDHRQEVFGNHLIGPPNMLYFD